MRTTRSFTTLAAIGLGAALLVPTAAVAEAPTSQAAKEAQSERVAEAAAGQRPSTPNPYLAFLPVGVEPDYAAWNAYLDAKGAERAAAQYAAKDAEARNPLATISVSEGEASGTSGSNDDVLTAEVVLGEGAGLDEDPEVVLSGEIADLLSDIAPLSPAEDDGSITLATDTGLALDERTSASGTIGDGPHGSGASGSGDFDVFQVDALAGETIIVDVDTPGASGLNSVVGLSDSSGNFVALNDDDGSSLDSYLEFDVTITDTYFVFIVGFGSAPGDPFDSSSGSGASSEGTYDVTISRSDPDVDLFAFDLRAGDVLHVLSTGPQPARILDAVGGTMMSSAFDTTGIMPASSPLRGGGSTASVTAPTDGTYHVAATGSPGFYDMDVQVQRQGSRDRFGGPQTTLFLDFDGATFDGDAIFGNGNPSTTLSPLSSFLSGWGLGPSDEDAVIDAILASFTESVHDDLAAAGLNPDFAVDIRNSRDDVDPFGDPGVTRIVIGGTIGELGIGTIGLAQSIDPGNHGLEETGVVLLDLLSAGAGDPNSLNQFPLDPSVTIVDMIGVGVGNIAAHEAGHMFGNWHSDQFVGPAQIMDQGGNLPGTVGVGVDGTLGTGDDVDVDFGTDTFVPSEGFIGTQDTAAISEFAQSVSRCADGVFDNGSFEDGMFDSWCLLNTLTDPYEVSRPETAGYETLDLGPGGMATTPTDGSRVGYLAFDGDGPGIAELSQVVEIPLLLVSAELTFDWRAGWAVFGSLDRTFDVVIRDAGSGAELGRTNILTAVAGTTTLDTGPMTEALDLTPFQGQAIQIAFESTVPENFTGPAALQIDDVMITAEAPPTAVDDAYDVDQGAALTVSATSGLLDNDTDPDGGPLTAALLTAPTHGTVTVDPDGGFTYAHDGSTAATDTFTYEVEDPTGLTDTGTVTLDVNRAPVADDDAYTGLAVGASVTVPAATGLLDNDTDADGDTLTVAVAAAPTAGTLTLSPSGGFTYAHDGSSTLDDAFTYTVSDAAGLTDSGTVTIEVGDDEVIRLAGGDRLATAVEISQSSYPNGASAVVLARSDEFADGLAGTPLTAKVNGPLLLTPSDALAATTKTEIDRLLGGSGTVYVLGGPVALSPAVASALTSAGYTVKRLAGGTRFETATAIADELGSVGTVILARAAVFADALAAGPAAIASNGAILLSAESSPHPSTDAWLAANPGLTVFAAGGPAATAYPAATPLVGGTRFETAREVAEEFFTDPIAVGVARADQFADALTGGAHIGRIGGPILLTPTDQLNATTGSYIATNSASVRVVWVYGGPVAVAQQVETALGNVV